MNNAKHKTILIDLDNVVRPLKRDGEQVQLQIRSAKGYHGGIEITGRVHAIDDHFITSSSSDWRKTFFTIESKRVTQKQIDKHFDELVTESFIEHVTEMAIAFYADLQEKKNAEALISNGVI